MSIPKDLLLAAVKEGMSDPEVVGILKAAAGFPGAAAPAGLAAIANATLVRSQVGTGIPPPTIGTPQDERFNLLLENHGLKRALEVEQAQRIAAERAATARIMTSWTGWDALKWWFLGALSVSASIGLYYAYHGGRDA